MIDLIVVGYPKSGNTWMTRLVAELVQCPVVGFFDYDHHDEIAIEGLDRESNYQCFKSHHQLSEFNEIINKRKNANQVINDYKIIYIIRDPRDVCVSGASFFPFERFPLLGKYMSQFPQGRKVYRLINRVLSPPSYRIKQMMHTVINGSHKVHLWVRIPWKNHYEPYFNDNYFIVKYEAMLDNPEQECKRILSFLGIERDKQQIKETIERQSFEKRKSNFLKSDEVGKARFLRVGKKEQWKEKLSREQQQLFLESLGDDLKRFNYPLS
ncbi:MAG: sulfotransferase domain-containing protein [Microcystaceae cyanobacterium]